MKAGAQISLHAMTDRFVEVIMDAVRVIQSRPTIETRTDDISTVVLGDDREVLATVRDAFAAAAASGVHVVLNAQFSRGCPGDDYCLADAPTKRAAGEAERATGPAERLERGADSSTENHPVACQFALYPLGTPRYMDQIYGAIECAKDGGTFTRSKHFVSRLDGTVAAVFDELFAAFVHAESGHVTIHATVSANSPSTNQ
ncbi:MAG: YkoF family thiamine/hydroxymethylpyrimidine-binding protein [Spirochaeta sp.]|jgi:uncharacterized protein YqgV (UPF0045/DUF77 family)|nr:YkoF family thiamine/hydroxymethylpyrimidine-binding protein [Spirochaeta sp.]